MEEYLLSEWRGRGDRTVVEAAAPMRRRSRRRLRERACRGRRARAVDANPRESPASSGRVGRAASAFLYKAGFRGKRDRQKLAQKLGVWPRLQLLAARIGPESQTNRHYGARLLALAEMVHLPSIPPTTPWAPSSRTTYPNNFTAE
jgi:hypothetical protein